jgi:hypothetical protein
MACLFMPALARSVRREPTLQVPGDGCAQHRPGHALPGLDNASGTSMLLAISCSTRLSKRRSALVQQRPR